MLIAARRGMSFIAETCEQLSIWISGGTDRSLFSLGTGYRPEKSQGGLRCLGENPSAKRFIDLFHVKLFKGYDHWRIDDFLILKYFPLKEDWDRLVKTAEMERRIPIFLLKQPKRPVMMLTNINTFKLPKTLCYMELEDGKHLYIAPFSTDMLPDFKQIVLRGCDDKKPSL